MRHDSRYYGLIQGTYGFSTPKDAALAVQRKAVAASFGEALFWEQTTVDGLPMELQITETAQVAVRKFITRPEDGIVPGAMVDWCGSRWIVTQVDANAQMVCSGMMTQCTALLRWRNITGEICVAFAAREDVRKGDSGIGIVEGVDIQVNSSQIRLVVPLNADTLAIRRDRRFLLGVFGPGCEPDAYVVTRASALANNLLANDGAQPHGVIELTLAQDRYRKDKDNGELGIADYYPLPAETPEGAEEGDMF